MSNKHSLNKKDLVAKLAKKTGITQAQALDVINELFSAEPGKGILAVALDAGGKVTIPGFGTFGTKTRKARTGTNPKDQSAIQIPEKSYAYFKAGKTLRERVAK